MDNIPKSINKLINDLDQLPASLANLTKLVQNLSFSREEFTPLLSSPGSFPYGRKMLHCDKKVEIILMNWSKMQHCLPHDHGDSFGVVFILSGRASHTVYTQLSGGSLIPIMHQIIDSNEILAAPKNIIHKMGSADPATPFITLHIYSSPIHHMRVYDLNAGKIGTVSDDCGAWWPNDARQVINIVDIVPFKKNQLTNLFADREKV